MFMTLRATAANIAAAAGVLSLCSAASAVSISSNYITINATAGANSATLIVPLTDNPFDSLPAVDEFNNIEVVPGIFFTGWDWRNGLSIDVRDPNTNTLLLTLVSLGVTAGRTDFSNGSPSRHGFDFDFTLIAGASNVDIQIQTGVLSFASVPNPGGRSDVGATLTDTSGSLPGATASGGFPGDTAFRALFNGTSIFRDYLDFSVPFSVGEDESDAVVDNMNPPGSFQSVGFDVSSMQAVYAFSVTANDQFSSTGTWVVLPAPGFGVLGILGFGAACRRRRR